ncbi:MAG: hypothetical protein ACOZQL_13810, partial [Myxococcota bacterium]
WVVLAFRKQGAVLFVLFAALALHLGALRLFTRLDDGDRGATQFLESVWLAPSGKQLEFRSR